MTLVSLHLLLARVANWESKSAEKRSAKELAQNLGVPIEDLQRDEMAEPILQHRSTAFSDKLWRNRLSDLCGVLNSIWNCVGCAALGVIFFTVLFASIAGNPEVAAKAWWMIPTAVFFWLVNIGFALGCRFTGRYPGEARQWRRSLLGS